MSNSQRITISATMVMDVHVATGLPLQVCRRCLEGMGPVQLEKYLDAVARQPGPLFHDPLEDDPALASIFAVVRREAAMWAEQEIQRRRDELEGDADRRIFEMVTRRAMAGRIASSMQKLLRERHGIEWLTPSEMNPGSRLD